MSAILKRNTRAERIAKQCDLLRSKGQFVADYLNEALGIDYVGRRLHANQEAHAFIDIIEAGDAGDIKSWIEDKLLAYEIHEDDPYVSPESAADEAGVPRVGPI